MRDRALAVEEAVPVDHLIDDLVVGRQAGYRGYRSWVAWISR
jgi:hypothetical protein